MRALLLLLLAGLLAAVGRGDDDEANYVRLLLRDLDGAQQPLERPTEGAVKRHWGISDATAVAGKLFTYPVPEDAFTGKIKRYEVTEAGESVLPDWLLYDEDSQTFSGVPLVKDLGQYYISVKAIGYSDGKSPSAKDVFSIEVVDDSSDSRDGGEVGLSGSCGESQTVANLVVDLDLDELNTTERTDLLKKLAGFLNVPVKKFKLSARTDKSGFDPNAELAGPGDAKTAAKAGAVAEWRVGCSASATTAEQRVMVSRLERSAEDGALHRALGHPIVGWHIVNVYPKVTRRDKRQAGTPVPGVQPTLWPRFTERVDDFELTEDTLTPETRIIPTMASPSLVQPTHHHRHGHGENGGLLERGHHHRMVDSPVLLTSPTLVHHQRMHTPIVAGTPVIFPDRPTKYIPATPVVEDPYPGRIYPEEHTPIVGLASSMLLPTPRASATDALPAQTYISMIEMHSSEIIRPTATAVEKTTTKPPPSTPNFKPSIKDRLQKLTVVAGKLWKYKIPKDTFLDKEDGDTTKLKLLFMTSERTAVQPNSWIQFDPANQMLYALPLDEDIGKYEFILEAMDSEGATTNDIIEIHVWQHQLARAKHHEFSVTLKYNKWQYPIQIDWNMEFINRLAKYLGDKNESSIAVQSVTTDPVTISWFNDSFPAHPCPSDEIASIANRIIEENSNKVTPAFTKVMKSGQFSIIDATVNLLGVCHSPASTTPTSQNFAPMLRNPIERINTTVGEILRFKIPDDTFYDFEDGSTRYLTLTFLTIENVRPPKSSWVQFDHKSQELYGLPFDGDAGRHEFQLVAMDSNSLQINDVFVIEVHPRPPKKWNVEFSLHIEHDYEEFSRDISKKVLVAWKLAKLYDDPDPRYITVSSISKGSVVYAWTNNTLPHDPCPKRTIDKLINTMINLDGTLSQKLVDAMRPDFTVIKADAMPLGICLGEVTPTSVTVAPAPVEPTHAEPAASSDDDIYITTIIPAVVIAAMLIIAALVACFLYRRKRKGKMTMQDSNTFIGNRAPVIFGDEMEEKPDPAKPPVIMREEKPPLAPPDYLRSSASSRDSTPHLDRVEQANLRNTNADLHIDPSPPYQPPPPFTTNRDSKNSRNKGTPTYRQPPPYMPPVPP